MAQIPSEEGTKRKGGKKRAKKHMTDIDMTPMVDLMCLLITFFMLTTAFSKPKVMVITMPEKDKNQEEKSQPLEFQITRVDGNKVWLEIQGSLVKLGNKTLLQTIIQDITEKKMQSRN